MNKTIKISSFGGKVSAIPSKSYAHRALICAAFADSTTVIKCEKTSRDIEATADCLTSLGAKIDYSDGCFTVNPIKNPPETASLPCGESGSTLRFLLPIAAMLGVDAEFEAQGRLASRPLSPLSDELVRHGAAISYDPIRIRGKIGGGGYRINGSVSSQFTTGLLLALSIGSCGSLCGYVEIQGKIESEPYIELTRAVLKKFGVDVIKSGNVYTPVGRLKSPGTVITEGDWSNAAFMLCAGAFSEAGVEVSGLDIGSAQGDRAIVRILSAFGADCTVVGDTVTVKKNVLRGITIDAGNIPDLVPVLSVVAAGAEGVTVIKNCGRLRLKESDRIESTCAMVRSLGGDISVDGDALVIHGKERLADSDVCVDSYNDHRIVMAAAVGSVLCSGSVTINGSEAAAKSYPGFFEDLCKIAK